MSRVTELLDYLQGLSEPELRAYCFGVRSGATQHQPVEILGALDWYIERLERAMDRPDTEIIDLVRTCDRCGYQLDGDRRRKRHIVCPVDPTTVRRADAATAGAVLAMEPRRAVVGRKAA